MKGRYHRGDDKWLHINQLVRDQRIGILALQETHLTKSEEDNVNQIFHHRLHVVSSSDPSAPNAKGVALVINKHLTNSRGIQTFDIIPGRALLARIPWHKDSHLNILNVYAPNDNSSNEAFWDQLRLQLKDLPKPDVMLGDFNLVEDALDRLPPHPDARSATEALATLKQETHLVDGWRKENPDTTAFTFAQSRAQGGRQSRIDRIYVNENILFFSNEWRIDPSGIHTDHQLISTKISDRNMPYVGKGRWSLPLFILNDKATAENIMVLGRDLQKHIDSMQTLSNRSASENPQTLFKSFKDAIITECRSAAKKAIPKIQQKMNTIKANLKAVMADKTLPEEERQERVTSQQVLGPNRKIPSTEGYNPRTQNVRLTSR
ncbi:DNase I-like protein [Paxillus ammoniavirescens]|nr:DNase I-like protein [Paxillus ammoniavirescens]